MRLFVALDLDEDVRARAARRLDAVRAVFRESMPHVERSVKWVPVENLHITLHFIGHVDEPSATQISEALSPPLDGRPFDLALGRLAAFPSSGRARVLWLAVIDRADRLSDVHLQVGSRLTRIGVPVEARRFEPHLTIGRFREPARPSVRQAVPQGPAVIGRWMVDHATLYESRLSSKGPIYTPLIRTPFTDRV